ncbi:hypothetical protein F66182_2419 [Fusarium sp. NRRL 66182]|nr:hypothetical protein F66182_2419 [Fusarium sp. NRRL 66182]
MKTSLFSAALLPFLAASSLAASDDDVICRTELGTASVATVETDTITKTDTVGPTTTITIIPTVTKKVGRWSTITKFFTKTFTVTGTAATDTFTTTTTKFKIATIRVTATATTTTTKTGTETSTSTTQVPTTRGFKPIKDTLNSDSLPLKRRKPFPSPLKYTASTRLLPNTTTKTVRRTGAPVTKTVSTLRRTTTTKTIPTTSTLIPNDVEVTKTFSTVMSVTTYSTIWTTSTKAATATTTKVLPGPTVYAACSPENVFGADFNSGGTGYFVSNVANNGPGIASDFHTVANGAGSAAECCSACQKFASCETWIYRARNRNCFLLYHTGGTCRSQANHPNYFMSKKGANTGAGFVVGNGNCGYTYSGNSDGSVFSVDV